MRPAAPARPGGPGTLPGRRWRGAEGDACRLRGGKEKAASSSSVGQVAVGHLANPSPKRHWALWPLVTHSVGELGGSPGRTLAPWP